MGEIHEKPSHGPLFGRELYDWITETQREGEQILNEKGLTPESGIRPMHVDYRAGFLLLENSLAPKPILTTEEVEFLHILRDWCRAVGRIIWGEDQYDQMREEWPNEWFPKLRVSTD